MAMSSFDRVVTIDSSNYKSLDNNVNKKDHKTIDLRNVDTRIVKKSEIKSLFE